jgi:transcriptional regulator with XRE-family HTH domain
MPKLSNAGPLLSKHLDAKTDAERARLFAKLTRKEVAGQIRQLREKRHLTQVEFAKRCRMKQSAVSRIEQAEYSGWTYKTLSRIAEKLNARLRISYEPLEEIAAQMAAEDGAESDPGRIQPPLGGRRRASDGKSGSENLSRSSAKARA